ncbi:MAG: UDP-N-acetylmuramoyl-L-alanine--D-glutamate ligase [Rhodospirillaceae bacterium]|nr:UDP-N-acetylmuramoyl-L-alanine--D-glutamate ligase [Rhodospirillaceae bacterium]
MIDLTHLKGRTVAVLGLGKSGLAAVEALVNGGATALAWDDAEPARKRAADLGADIADLADPATAIEGIDRLVLSPGVPRSHPVPHPVVARLAEAGMPIEIDIDLLAEARPDARYLGITGTNGKSTTTALVGHILSEAGVPVAVGGNLGPPALGLDPIGADGWYVLELSSYQLETVARPRWQVAVLLNISPDHLDRYPGMMAYVTAKTRIFEALAIGGTAVVGIDDDWASAVYYYETVQHPGHAVAVSVDTTLARGVWVIDGTLVDALDGTRTPVLDLAEAPALPGVHNWQNAAAAYAAARSAGVAPDAIVTAIKSFPGLPHRQERVAEIGGVAFINDSKATNPDAAVRALACYRPIYWIAGGKPKPGGLGPIHEELDRVAAAFLIGEAEAAMAEELAGKVPVVRCGTLDRAVAAAARQAQAEAQPGATVLLSPACASFDQFANFEARGAAFAALVHGLAGQGDAAGGTAKAVQGGAR